MHRSVTTIATSHFEFATPAGPVQVWRALTCPELTTRYLFGMSLQSEWSAGAPVVVQPPIDTGAGDRVAGEVLVVEEGRRLSYTLSSGPTDPTTFVTWQIEPSDGGCKVCLYVDETQAASGADDDVEAPWAEAVSALRTILAGLLT